MKKDEELLSILLRTGTSNKSVKDVSIDILRKIKMNDLINYDLLIFEKATINFVIDNFALLYSLHLPLHS